MPNEPGRIIVCIPLDSAKVEEIATFIKERFAVGRANIGKMKVVASGYPDAFPGHELYVLWVQPGKENAWVEFFRKGNEGQNRITAFPLKKKRNLSAFIKTVHRLHR